MVKSNKKHRSMCEYNLIKWIATATLHSNCYSLQKPNVLGWPYYNHKLTKAVALRLRVLIGMKISRPSWNKTCDISYSVCSLNYNEWTVNRDKISFIWQPFFVLRHHIRRVNILMNKTIRIYFEMFVNFTSNPVIFEKLFLVRIY